MPLPEISREDVGALAVWIKTCAGAIAAKLNAAGQPSSAVATAEIVVWLLDRFAGPQLIGSAGPEDLLAMEPEAAAEHLAAEYEAGE